MKKLFSNLLIKNCSVMTFFLLAAFLCFHSGINAQQNDHVEITLNEKTNTYGYMEVFEFPGAKKDEIRKAVLAAIPQQNLITYQDQEQIVMNYSNVKVGMFTYISFKEKFVIKDGKLKWEITDLYHLFLATNHSKPTTLNEIKGKKRLADALNLFNKLLAKSRAYTKKSIVINSQEDDW